MTPHLHVQLRLHETVVDDRLVEVREQAWFGECDGAAVAFEGGIVGVRAGPEGLSIRGVPLEPGQPWSQRWGDVELRLEAMVPERLPRDWSWVPDPVLLVATVALVLLGAFIDTAGARWERAAEDEAAVEQRLGGVPGADERYAEDPAPRPEPSSLPPSAVFTSEAE